MRCTRVLLARQNNFIALSFSFRQTNHHIAIAITLSYKLNNNIGYIQDMFAQWQTPIFTQDIHAFPGSNQTVHIFPIHNFMLGKLHSLQ